MAAKGATLGAALSLLTGHAAPDANAPPQMPPSADGGTITVPSFQLPFSAFGSLEAREDLQFRLDQSSRRGETSARQGNRGNPLFDRWIKEHDRLYRVKMSEEKIDGIRVQIFEPEAGIKPKNRDRVLINLHGGGFVSGWDTWSRTESIPIAATAGIKVISVEYRMAPQNRFPAASEDVEKIYRSLLKTHKPSQIGIYGCSAGGILTGQALARFHSKGLPMPAAAAIFSAYTVDVAGDSVFISGRIGGMLPAPPGTSIPNNRATGYFADAKRGDPLVTPSSSPELLSHFPPTLFITGNRAFDVSPMTRSHIDLVNAGVDARLFVWDGVDHCFTYNPALRESQEAYKVTADFFDQMMDRAQKRRSR